MHGISLEQQLKELKECSKERLSRSERWHNKAQLRYVTAGITARERRKMELNKETKELYSNIWLGVFGVIVCLGIFIGTSAGTIPSMTTMVGGPTNGLILLALLFIVTRR